MVHRAHRAFRPLALQGRFHLILEHCLNNGMNQQLLMRSIALQQREAARIPAQFHQTQWLTQYRAKHLPQFRCAAGENLLRDHGIEQGAKPYQFRRRGIRRHHFGKRQAKGGGDRGMVNRQLASLGTQPPAFLTV